jgi:hypothetical protein
LDRFHIFCCSEWGIVQLWPVFLLNISVFGPQLTETYFLVDPWEKRKGKRERGIERERERERESGPEQKVLMILSPKWWCKKSKELTPFSTSDLCSSLAEREREREREREIERER